MTEKEGVRNHLEALKLSTVSGVSCGFGFLLLLFVFEPHWSWNEVFDTQKKIMTSYVLNC